MKIKLALSISTIFLLAGCISQGKPALDVDQTQSIEQAGQSEDIITEDTLIPTEVLEDPAADETQDDVDKIEVTPPLETKGPDCYGTELNQVGQGIADKFEQATYEQVMLWFCNGAEFENILVSLQTEELTGNPAEEMLIKVAAGQTWEEIWQSIGLIDE